MAKLVLASGSPRRQELLSMLGVDFKVIPPDIDENDVVGQTPVETVELAAWTKAQWVAKQLADGVVLGADTIVLLDTGEVLGKPLEAGAAMEMLFSLSGRSHQVVTGVALLDPSNDRMEVFHVVTRVFFRQLSSDEIHRYVATGEPLDKAGAYGIQGKGSLLVERIEGCYFNVVGLPLPRLGEVLRDFGIMLL
ncbi:MAG: septum formation inhibitor Maf [Firmicutes bacterium]|nr:septum formation inhibitor Maf [Bacillota bacterium]